MGTDDSELTNATVQVAVGATDDLVDIKTFGPATKPTIKQAIGQTIEQRNVEREQRLNFKGRSISGFRSNLRSLPSLLTLSGNKLNLLTFR